MGESVLRRITVLAVPTCLVLALAAPAAAKPIIIGPFIITLHEGSSTLTNNSGVVSGSRVCAGDGSAIGDALPPGECIDVGSALLLQIFGGGIAVGQASGFGTSTDADPDGDSSFTGLPFDSPGAITSVTASSPGNGVTGPGGLGLPWTNDSVSFSPGGAGGPSSGTNPGQLVPPVDGGSTTNADPGNTDPGSGTDPVIDPIPEPASLTLIGTGLAAAALRRRRRSGAA